MDVSTPAAAHDDEQPPAPASSPAPALATTAVAASRPFTRSSAGPDTTVEQLRLLLLNGELRSFFDDEPVLRMTQSPFAVQAEPESINGAYAGIGLCLTRAVAAGELLVVYGGDLRHRNSFPSGADRTHCMRYPHSDWVVDGSEAADLPPYMQGAFLNSSPYPNVTRELVLPWHDCPLPLAFFVAAADLPRGTFLHWKYPFKAPSGAAPSGAVDEIPDEPSSGDDEHGAASSPAVKAEVPRPLWYGSRPGPPLYVPSLVPYEDLLRPTRERDSGRGLARGLFWEASTLPPDSLHLLGLCSGLVCRHPPNAPSARAHTARLRADAFLTGAPRQGDLLSLANNPASFQTANLRFVPIDVPVCPSPAG